MAPKRCHGDLHDSQPDTKQDMIFQIMQNCFHHMLYSWFCGFFFKVYTSKQF